MFERKPGKLLVLILLVALLSALLAENVKDTAHRQRMQKETIDNLEYRRTFYCQDMRANDGLLSPSCKSLLHHVEKEVKYFPVPESTVDQTLTVSYVDSWMAERKYNGTSGHEGTDIMAQKNERGLYPVLSMTEGVITNLGWLEKGGYRVGVTSESGTYYYYAHLESYGNIQEGDVVKSGQLLGYMGDSGYGEEGTTGQFDVHLHLGIYSYDNGKEISVNPYYVLLSLEKDENKKLKYAYF